MKILIECRKITPGTSCGIENFVYSIVRGILTAFPNDELFLNIPPGTKLLYQAKVSDNRVIFLEDSVLFSYYNFRSRFCVIRNLMGVVRLIHPMLTRWLEGPRSDWIHQCEDKVDVVLYPYQRDRLLHFRKPSLVVMHDFYDFDISGISSRQAKIEAKNLHQADAIVTSWPSPFDSLRHYFPEMISKSFMIPFSFHPIPAGTSELSKSNSRLLVYPASTSPHKNHANLIRALGILARDGFTPVRVICPGYQLPWRVRIIKRLIDKENVGDWIKFPGFVSREQINKLYREADGVVAPTKYEAFSGAVYEGFQYAKPIACSHIPSLTSFIDLLGANVRYFNPDSPHDIASAIKEILQNPTPYRNGSIKARNILRRITLEKTAKQYHEVLAWISGNSSKPL